MFQLMVFGKNLKKCYRNKVAVYLNTKYYLTYRYTQYLYYLAAVYFYNIV
jgi:hypothetical protein